MSDPRALLVLYGSETGNAQDVAERIARESARRGFAPSVLPLDAFELTELPNQRRAVFVTSTMGRGDPPGNAKAFWQFLRRKSLPSDSLKTLNFAVFGLGDSHYQKYNAMAKKLFKRLESLGGRPVTELGLGDDQHPVGYDAGLDPWLVGLWRVCRVSGGFPWREGNAFRDAGDDEGGDDASDDDGGKYAVEIVTRHAVMGAEDDGAHVDTNPPGVETLLAVKLEMDRVSNAGSPVDRKLVRGKDDWGEARIGPSDGRRVAAVVSNTALTTETAVAQTRHVELSFATSHLTGHGDETTTNTRSNNDVTNHEYAPGDCLEVTPFAFFTRPAETETGTETETAGNGYGKCADAYGRLVVSAVSGSTVGEGDGPTTRDEINTPTWATGIDYLLRRCGVEPCSFVKVTPAKHEENEHKFEPKVLSARSLVAGCLDIASASPRRFFYETAARFASNPDETERLVYFASPEGRDDLYKYGIRERRTVLEFLDDFPSVQMPLRWLLQVAPRLKPRLFSIASSSALDGADAVHLTVTVAIWRTHYGRARRGLCSDWMTDPVRLRVGDLLAARIVRGAYAFPENNQPTLAVCTGSGVAPIRAMVRHRKAGFDESTTPWMTKNGSSGLGSNDSTESETDHKTKNAAAPCLVFFGCRHSDRDFLYRDEWEGLGGVLRGNGRDDTGASGADDGGSIPQGGFVPCFSRDKEKEYVSHGIRANSKNVWAFLRASDCKIVVCGSAGDMPEDVLESFVFVCQLEGGMDETQARMFLRKMDARGQYVVEAW